MNLKTKVNISVGQEKNRTTRGPEAIRLVDSRETLADAASAFETQKQIAVDVEADSMFHFREKVCLIQMATADSVYIIDPLRLTDISALLPIFKSRDIRKIFHGADYDVRSLYRDFGVDIHNLFDTELAARFLGLRETGLDALLGARFGVRLDKRFQRKDWSRRPLPEEMLTYAAGDVEFLIPLADQLEKELAERKRLSWVNEECRHLSRVRSMNNGDQPLFLSVKGAGKLKPRRLAVLEQLLQLRRQIAKEKDRPLFKVLNSQALLKIAAVSPRSLDALEATETLSRKQIGMYGRPIIDAVLNGLNTPKDELQPYPRRSAPVMPPAVPRRVQALKAWRDREAEALGMDPGMIINKSLMQTIATLNPSRVRDLDAIPDLRSWRRSAFGKAIVETLKKHA
ncbi:MAG: ribonuclease D [Desulfobacterales bacterium]